MSNKVTIAELVSRNKHIASTNPPNHITFSELAETGMGPPQVVIFTCADPRCDPTAIMGLKPLETVVIRNPCGHVAPNIEGLLALDCLMGGFAEAMIVHHTDCGASMYTDESTRKTLKDRTGTKQNLENMTFGAVTDLEKSVRDDVAVLKEHPLVRKDLKEKTQGFLYDIKTGLLTNMDE